MCRRLWSRASSRPSRLRATRMSSSPRRQTDRERRRPHGLPRPEQLAGCDHIGGGLQGDLPVVLRASPPLATPLRPRHANAPLRRRWWKRPIPVLRATHPMQKMNLMPRKKKIATTQPPSRRQAAPGRRGRVSRLRVRVPQPGAAESAWLMPRVPSGSNRAAAVPCRRGVKSTGDRGIGQGRYPITS
jgi:hypothetical protein